MKPNFTNKTTMSTKTCKDFLALTWPQNAGIWRILFFLAALFALAYAVFRLATKGGQEIMFAIGLFLMAAFAVFFALFGYIFNIKNYIKAEQKRWKAATLKKELFFYDDYFIQKSEMGEVYFEYNKVSKWLENKNSIVLCAGGAALLFQKNGFENAENIKEIKRLINNKK